MKNKIKITILVMLLISLSLSAESINKPAAVVRYTQTKVISQAELDSAYENSKKALELTPLANINLTKEEVLDNMIDTILLEQGAKKEGIKVDNATVNLIMDAQKKQIEEQLGKTITEKEFEDLFSKEAHMPYEKAISELKKTQLIQGFIQKRYGNILENKDFNPTEDEINDFFKKNRSTYVQPEMVGVSHIFIPKNDDALLDIQNQSLLKKVSKDLKANKITWETAVKKYSQDENTKDSNGNLNYLSIDDNQIIDIIGQDFFDTAFALKEGETSNLIKSSTGYHIIKNTGHYDAKLLKLNDKVYPNQDTTLKEVITTALISDKQQKYMRELVEKLIDEIKEKSSINIIYKEGK